MRCRLTYFPLRFFQTDIAEKICSLDKVIDNNTIGKLILNGMLELIIKGKFRLNLQNDLGAKAIQYGLGFGSVSAGTLWKVVLEEIAVIECLRYLITPFAMIAKNFVKRMSEAINPQTVGYLLEYLVAFALVANCVKNPTVADKVEVWQGLPGTYLTDGDETQVCFQIICVDQILSTRVVKPFTLLRSSL
jgi:hypothetical protein